MRSDIKTEYALLKAYQRAYEQHIEQAHILEDTIIEKKRSIRRTQKRNAHDSLLDEEGWRYPNDGWYDSRYKKIKVPFLMTEEEQQEYKDEEWERWYNPWGDGRDCTGVWFTRGIDFIKTGENSMVIIHWQGCDI